MAYTPCSSAVTKNIVADCTNPIVGGYTGRAVLIAVGDATFTQDSTNAHKVTDIALGSSKKTIAVNNIFAEPLSGSNTASNADTGRTQYTKTLSMRIPARGADISKNLVEALAESTLGFIAVVEKKDKVGDGSFEVIGLLQGLKVNADGISRDESANGGDIAVAMSCVEPWFEVSYLEGTYAATLAAFEALWTTSAN